jgi:20S proteasome subunit beta 7
MGVKYAGGVMVAADTIASYGSLVRYEGVLRMAAVGIANDTILAAGGDYSDYQYILKVVEGKAVEEFAMDDGCTIPPAALHNWLNRMMYQRRTKVDPLWNSVIVAGFRDGVPYLGSSNLYGTMFEDTYMASGLGAHLALPLLRKGWREDLTEAEARSLLEDCMRVLFYRDTRASSFITIGKVDASGSTITEPFQLETYWEFPAFTRGNTTGDGSW